MDQLWKNYERIRKQKGMKDFDIAYRAGMSKQSLCEIKKRGSPTVRTILRLAKALNVKPEVFFYGIEC